MRKLLALLLVVLQGCWTNSAVRMGGLRPPAREAPILVRFSNPSDAAIPDPGPRIRDALRRKGYRLAGGADEAVVLDVVVKAAQWTPVGERIVGGVAHVDPLPRGPRPRGHGGGGKLGDAEIALFVIFFVVLIGVAIAESSQPTEWLTGRVDVSLQRGEDPPQQASIDLRFSCATDRAGTLGSVRDHIAERVAEMF